MSRLSSFHAIHVLLIKNIRFIETKTRAKKYKMQNASINLYVKSSEQGIIICSHI